MTKLLKSLFILLCFMLVSYSASAGILNKTWTKYPIVLVPGVFDWDNVLGMNLNYFFQVEEAIESTSYSMNLFKFPYHQKTYFIPLNPWQNTRGRAADLKQKLDKLMARHNYKKVNIIAHSHGTTTSRAAIRWMVLEAKNNNKPNPIASFTSIAGPHFGTPAADFYMANDIEALSTMLDLAGNFAALMSFGFTDTGIGMFEYLGNQKSADVFRDFSQPHILQFNIDFPSAGLPKNAGLYGKNADTFGGAPAGNGLGKAMDPNDPEAILYYSWTGNIGNKWNTALDISDAVMLVTKLMNNEQGFTDDADGFIPVTSARFGKVLCENYYWNHIDEMNNLVGIVNLNAADPLLIYRLHAQRLQKAGR